MNWLLLLSFLSTNCSLTCLRYAENLWQSQGVFKWCRRYITILVLISSLLFFLRLLHKAFHTPCISPCCQLFVYQVWGGGRNMRCVNTVRYFPFTVLSYMRKWCLMNRADHKFSDATLLLLKTLIGFCIAGLAGSPASQKPAWKVVILSSTFGPTWPVPLATHLSVVSWHCCLLPVARSYPLGCQQLNELPIRCPSANSFASSFLELLASKLLARPGDCQATHVVARDHVGRVLARELRHQPRSVSKCFLYMWVKPSWEGCGEVCQHDFLCGVSIPVPSSGAGQSQNILPFCGSVCLLVLSWQMHSVCVWVPSREDQQLVDLHHTRWGSLLLCNLYCTGRDCRLQIVGVAKKALLACALLPWLVVGEAWFLEVFMREVSIWNLVSIRSLPLEVRASE